MAAGMVAIAACEKPPPEEETQLIDGIFTSAEWEKVKTHSPLPDPPPNPSNKYVADPKAAALGQALFYDRGYSGPITTATNPNGSQGEVHKVNCTSCHKPDH